MRPPPGAARVAELVSFDQHPRHSTKAALPHRQPCGSVEQEKGDKKKIVIPSKKQFSDLINVLRQDDNRYLNAANLCELLAYSVMRLAEATSLAWTDIDFEKNRFTALN